MAGMLARVLMANSAGLYPPVRGTRKTPRRKRATIRKRATKRAAVKRRAAARTRKPARLVKGSAAAKRYMASIRRKRRR